MSGGQQRARARRIGPARRQWLRSCLSRSTRGPDRRLSAESSTGASKGPLRHHFGESAASLHRPLCDEKNKPRRRKSSRLGRPRPGTKSNVLFARSAWFQDPAGTNRAQSRLNSLRWADRLNSAPQLVLQWILATLPKKAQLLTRQKAALLNVPQSWRVRRASAGRGNAAAAATPHPDAARPRQLSARAARTSLAVRCPSRCA